MTKRKTIEQRAWEAACRFLPATFSHTVERHYMRQCYVAGFHAGVAMARRDQRKAVKRGK